MLQELESIINAANADYTVYFDESVIMNNTAKTLELGEKFAQIEEYTTGSYSTTKYNFKNKTTKTQIYFSVITDKLNWTARGREAIREMIESEVILSFIAEYNKSQVFEKVSDFRYYTIFGRFSSYEVSIMLEFDTKLKGTC